MRRLFPLLAVLALTGCHGDKKTSGIDLAKLCADGHASLSGNECVCTPGNKWNGVRCITPEGDVAPAAEPSPVPREAVSPPPAPDAVPPASAPPQASESGSDAAIMTDPNPDPAAAAPHTAASARTAAARAAAAAANAKKGHMEAPDRARNVSLEATCKRAGAMWVAADATCHCADAKVLVGLSCRRLSGAPSHDSCVRAIYPGVWHEEHCDCPRGKVFSPPRGGCAAALATSELSLRRICESSMNRGKWEVRGQRCFCPSGRVWRDESCAVQQELTSRDVCESAFNRGRWNPDRKRCDCPTGRTWIDQTCRPTSLLSPPAACESEGNGGRWQAAEGTCSCPRGGRWSPSGKTCR